MFTYQFRKISVILVLFILVLSACNIPSDTAPTEQDSGQESNEAIFTMAAQTIIAEITQTAIYAPTVPSGGQATAEQPTAEQPTVTSVTPPTVTAPPPAEEQPTATNTPTESSEYPTISATANTNCRLGPDSVFDVVGYLLVGDTSEVHGKGISGYWWYIANPISPGGFCWVWAQTTKVEGDTSNLPIIESPPTPTPTSTPTTTLTPTPTLTATATLTSSASILLPPAALLTDEMPHATDTHASASVKTNCCHQAYFILGSFQPALRSEANVLVHRRTS